MRKVQPLSRQEWGNPLLPCNVASNFAKVKFFTFQASVFSKQGGAIVVKNATSEIWNIQKFKKKAQNDLKRAWVANRHLSLWLLYMPGLAGCEKVRDFILVGTKQVSLSPSQCKEIGMIVSSFFLGQSINSWYKQLLHTRDQISEAFCLCILESLTNAGAASKAVQGSRVFEGLKSKVARISKS